MALMDQLRRRLAEQQAVQAQVGQVRGGVAAQPMPQEAPPLQAQAVAQHQQQLGYGAAPMPRPVAPELAAVQDRAQLGYQQAARSPLAGAVAQQQAQMLQRQAVRRRRRLPF